MRECFDHFININNRVFPLEFKPAIQIYVPPGNWRDTLDDFCLLVSACFFSFC
jgi:hypothetical protein